MVRRRSTDCPLISVLLGIVGLILLFFGGEILVRGASGLALRFGLSPLAIGLTVVAFGTSAPELLVSLDAAFSGANDISVGNVVGSNIANIALILGIAAVLRPMAVESRLLGVDVPVMIVATLVLLAFIVGGFVSRLEGLVLVSGLGVYVFLTFRHARSESASARALEAIPTMPWSGTARLGLFVALGLAMLFAGAHLLVGAAVELATQMNVSQAAIGLTVVAVGTSLPELATSVVASIKRQGDIAIGNVVGSNTFNILGVLGVTAAVHPLESGEIGWLDFGLMAGLAFLLGALLWRRLFLTRLHGVLLLLVFVVYTVWTLG